MEVYRVLKKRKLQHFKKEKEFLEQLFNDKLNCLDSSISRYLLVGKEFTDNFYINTPEKGKLCLLTFEQYLESIGFTTEWMYHSLPIYGIDTETYKVDGLIIRW